MAQYYYDATGERAASKIYTSGSATGFMQFLREGGQVLYEKSWSLPGYAVTGEKTYIGAGGAMAVTRQTVSGTTTTSYYAVDHLGTVRSVVTVNASGVETGRTFHDFEPFGVEIAPLQTSPNTHRYTGHERDVLDATPATYFTNDYMHFRYMGVGFARFMRPDNVNGTAMNPQSWNLYSYVHGNPVTMSDPTGHVAGIPYRGYYAAGGDIAGSCGVHMEANALGGGLGLGGLLDDLAFSGAFDAWCSLMDLAGWGYNPRSPAASAQSSAPQASNSSTADSPYFLGQGQLVYAGDNVWAWAFEEPSDAFASEWEVSFDAEFGHEGGKVTLDLGLGFERNIYVEGLKATWISDPGSFFPKAGTSIDVTQVLYRVASQEMGTVLGVPYAWTNWDAGIGNAATWNPRQYINNVFGSPWSVPSIPVPSNMPVANHYEVIGW